MMRILGLEGKAGTGKTTLAHRIAMVTGATIAPFGDIVRSYAMEHYAELGFPKPSWDKPYPPEVRKLLCVAGDKMRENDPLAVIKAWKCSASKVIIPDVRYPAERDFVRQHGRTWYLWRPTYDVVDHESEDLQPDGNLVVLPEIGSDVYEDLVYHLAAWLDRSVGK